MPSCLPGLEVAHAAVALFAAALVGISCACGNFDIISGHFSWVPQLHATLHEPGIPFFVTLLTRC